MPTDAAWQPIGEVAGASPTATLVPITSAGPYIAPTTAFTLASLSGEPAAALAARLVIEPASPLVVEAGADAAHVTVRPSTAPPAGAVVRFRLSDTHGALAASWAYQVDQAPRIVGTLPDDGATQVPLNSGIEATFDQDGITVPASAFTISPSATGRIQVNGRTTAFVPDALAPDTLYTVTVHRGVGRPGSAYTLAQDVTWRFQTARLPGDTAARVQLVGQLFNADPRDTAVLTVSVDNPSETGAVPQVQVVAARLPNRAAAVDAVRTLAARPEWASAGHAALVPTSGLPVVVRARRSIEALSGSWVSVVRLPETLPAGWYLATLTVNGTVSQAVLQVTDLAPLSVVTATRTLVWVNDTTTHRAVSGCRVTLSPGGVLGRTAANGILDAATPAAAVADAGTTGPKGDQGLLRGTVLLLDARDGRSAFTVPGGGVLSGMAFALSGSPVGPADEWWHALTTDRYQFRSTDTVNVWGYVRGRTRLDVPASLEVTLAASGSSAPIATATVAPRPTGAFAVALPIRDLPAGAYNVRLRIGGVEVDAVGIAVADIRKPLYRLDVTPNRFAVLAGESFDVTVAASFYDGAPASGITVDRDGDDSLIAASLTTAADGTSRTSITAPGEAVQSGAWPSQRSLSVRAAAAEDGQINGAGSIVVFSSSVLVDATASLHGRSMAVDGAIHRADVARLNALPNLDAAMAADPRGAAVAKQRASITVTEHWMVSRRTGTAYDPITKRTSPVYEWTEKTSTLAPVRVTTDAQGRFRAAITVPRADHWYTATVRTVDAGSRPAVAEASTSSAPEMDAQRPTLSFAPATGGACPISCRIGQSYSLRLVGSSNLPRGGTNRYLFLVEQRGLQRWSLSSTPARTDTFRASDAPGISLDAVWFTGTAYVLAGDGARASVALDARTLHVSVTPDRARYEPGTTASVQVSVTGPDGRPAAGASLVAAVVDEKLFDASGGPPISDPVAMLYGWMPTGVLGLSGFPSLVEAHSSCCGGGKGSTTGGGGGPARSDFRDSLLFQTFTTDAAGRTTIRIPLSDDLTSWRVAVAAVDSRIQGGIGTASLAVGLPFFVDATISAELLASDRPSVVVRAFGSSLAPATRVTFTVSSDTLPMAPVTVTAPASIGAAVPLSALSAGTHRLTITATAGAERDSLVRTFVVIGSRRSSPVVQSWALSTAALRPAGDASGLSTYVISDASRGQWLARLLELASADGTRADEQAAAIGARTVLADVFHLGEPALPPKRDGMDSFRTPGGGIAILPYGSGDLEMTTRTMLAAPGTGSAVTSAWLRAIMTDRGETPERRSVALTGLAAMGEPVLASIQARAAAPDTPPREALWLGLGLAALGDEASAASIAKRVAADAGQHRGIEIRIAVDGGADAIAEATARFAELAAAVGDPLAEPAFAYAVAHPSATDLHVAEELAMIRSLVAREPETSASVAWTVDGRRTVTSLAPATSLTVVLTPAQRSTAAFEAVSGNVTVVGQWRREGPPQAPPVATLGVERTVTPAGPIERSSMVRVVLTPAVDAHGPSGTYRIDELVPSGLVPLDVARTWDAVAADPSGEGAARCQPPDSVEGQLVQFTMTPATTTRQLCYLARVAMPGTFAWEPATIWSEEAPEDWAATPATSVTIR